MPSRVFMICNAYESGFGHGLANDGNELPAALDIINTYQAQEGKDFTLLGTPPANQPEPPSPRTTPFGLKTVR